MFDGKKQLDLEEAFQSMTFGAKWVFSSHLSKAPKIGRRNPNLEVWRDKSLRKSFPARIYLFSPK